jgi:hypothetical protein
MDDVSIIACATSVSLRAASEPPRLELSVEVFVIWLERVLKEFLAPEGERHLYTARDDPSILKPALAILAVGVEKDGLVSSKASADT